MKKKIIKLFFLIYQKLTASNLPSCRYQPTCSLYAYESILKYGLLKGSTKAVKRILSCHPFSQKPFYDPV